MPSTLRANRCLRRHPLEQRPQAFRRHPLNPAQVAQMRLEKCHLPETGWELLNLAGGVVSVGGQWTDDGPVHEVHSRKRCAATATRPVPIPPQFVRLLRAHIERFEAAQDGRLLRDQANRLIGA